MRLTCPNCGAQYEIPEVAIRAPGREVQCSACGTAWFQAHPDAATPEANATPASEPQPADEAEANIDTGAEPAPAPRQRIDPSVADILRAEAERERSARAAEAARRHAPSPETEGTTQQDPTPLGAGESVSGPGRDPFPRIEDTAPTASTAEAARASLAPAADAGRPRRRRHGFRTGLLLAVLACATALGVYLLAPDIARHVPAAGTVLESYVEAIDTARRYLADTARTLLAQL